MSAFSPVQADVPIRPAQTIDVDRFVDGRSISAFHINLLIWPLLVMVADGFDLVVMGFAAPSIVKAWGIERASMGPILSASLIGMLIGTPVLGYLGDRLGRRPLIIFSTILFGLATWATVLATNVQQLFILRFVTGIGLAGIIPNITALVSEFAPRRVRGTFLIVVQLGVQVGAIVPGLVAAYLVATHGWEVLFHVGGLAPIILALILAFVLPESIKYLRLRPERRASLLKVTRALAPEVEVGEATDFTSTVSATKPSLSPLVPFRNGMHIITPLLWALGVVSLFSNLLLAGWAPTVLQDVGLSPAKAALTVSVFAFGGLVGSLILAFGFNRYGFLVVILFYLIAAPATALIGQPFLSAEARFVVAFVTGVCVSGTQSAINSALGMLYPTSIRANSAGWGMAIARLGAVAGPLAGGYLVGMHVSGRDFFEIAAIPLLVGLLLAIGLAYQCRRRFGVWTLDEKAASPR